MAKLLEIQHQEFEPTLINMARILMRKTDSRQERRDNVGRKINVLRNNHKKRNFRNKTPCSRNEECL